MSGCVKKTARPARCRRSARPVWLPAPRRTVPGHGAARSGPIQISALFFHGGYAARPKRSRAVGGCTQAGRTVTIRMALVVSAWKRGHRLCDRLTDQLPGRSDHQGRLAQPRRRGMAKLLLRAVLDRLRHSGIQTVWLYILDGNDPAMRLYQEFGFQSTNQRQQLPDHPAGSEELMRLRLN